MPFEDEGLTRFLESAASHRILSQREEQELARKAQRGDEEARKTLLLHNIRLVVAIARTFMNRGLPLEDLIQAGVIGLDRATRKFDPGKGFKLSTYASWWIRQAIQRTVAAHGKTIRVPNQVATRRLQIDAVLRENPSATYSDLAEKLECTTAQVIRAMRTAEVVASLDTEQSDDMQTLFDKIPNTNADDPAELVRETRGDVTAALESLTPLQRRVVTLRFGFDGEEEMTIQQVAEFLEVPLSVVQTAQRESFTFLRGTLNTGED